MSNKITAFPAHNDPAPLHRHAGRILSGAELAIGYVGDDYFVEGSGTVRTIAYMPPGVEIRLRMGGAPTFVNSSKLLMPGATDKRFAAGDVATFRSEGDGVWRCTGIVAANPGPIFVFEGDSLSNTGHYGTWPTLVPTLSAFFNRGKSYNWGVDGDLASSMVSRWAAQAGTIKFGSGIEAYYSIWAGHNDLAASVSASTVYGYLTTMWAERRAAGYKVVAWTIMGGSDFTSTQNNERFKLNSMILSDPSLYDFVVRADDFFTDYGDAYNFVADGIHLTTAGNTLVAQRFINALLGMTPRTSIPTVPNLAVNGTMAIDQANSGALVSNVNGYATDGVQVLKSGTMVLASQRVTDAPPGFAYSEKVTVTTAQASLSSGDYAMIFIPVEGDKCQRLNWGSDKSSPITVSFWKKYHRAAAFSGAVRNAGGARGYPFVITQAVADAWEYHQFTIPGDVSGTWNKAQNTTGLALAFALAGGSSVLSGSGEWVGSNIVGVSGSTNGVQSTSDTFQIAGVDIRRGIYGPSRAESVQAQRSEAEEFALARRYLRVREAASVSEYIGQLQAISTTQAGGVLWSFGDNPMMDSPTVTVSAPGHLTMLDAGAGAHVVTGCSFSTSNYGANCILTTASGLVAGSSVVTYFSSPSGKLIATKQLQP